MLNYKFTYYDKEHNELLSKIKSFETEEQAHNHSFALQGNSMIGSLQYIDVTEIPCLFEDYENQPKQVVKILDEYLLAENDYDTCMDLVEKLEEIGYTCEYGLDNEPFNLRKNV